MINLNLNISQRAREFYINFIVMCYMVVSGIFLSIAYFVLDTIHTVFSSANCTIDNNVLVGNCQELWGLALFPILNLREIFIYANYFFIFGLVIGLFYMGFMTKKHPVLLPVHVVFSIILGYISILIANVYRTIIENQVMYNMLTPFVIYNRIMLNFPTFMFFVAFLSGAIGFMGVYKSKQQFNEGTQDFKGESVGEINA